MFAKLPHACRLVLLLAFLASPLASSTRASSILYNVTNLGIRDPIALNDAGQVALNQTTSYYYANPFGDESQTLRNSTLSSYGHALLYDGYGPNAGGMTFVGQALPGATGDPTGLNSETTYQGTTLAKPETTDIATGLTASGQVAVTSAAGSFLTDGKTYQVAPPSPAAGLKTPDGSSISTSSSAAINASGQIAGTSITLANNDNQHAVLVSNGKVSDLGTLGGQSSTANAINASGQVVGASQVSPTSGMNPYSAPTHAFLATGGVMKDLGTLGGTNSTAYGINAQGMVVGASDPSAGNSYSNYWSQNAYSAQRAFLYDGTKMIDLNSVISDQLNLTLNRAVAINSSGQILVYGQAGSNDLENAYILTPVGMPTPVTPTLAPEPGTLAILGLAVGAALVRRRPVGRKSEAQPEMTG